MPYGVKVKVKYYDDNWRLLAIYTNGTTYVTRDIGYPIETYFEDCKPYFRPMSSMTEEEKSMYEGLMIGTDNISYMLDVVDWLNAHHFDYRGLIDKSLALDATGLNIY